jgi:hypothetical protein
MTLRQIARMSGRTLSEVTEDWNERASIREYLGGYPRAEAERLAIQDVEEQAKAKVRR